MLNLFADASLLGRAERFNNEIHDHNWIPIVQADVKAVSRPFPTLGLRLACETTYIYVVE